jgi:ferric-dicitrate binding protein FerR (iron transport regulator)
MAWARQGESIDRPPAQRKQKERECEDAPRRAERRGLLKKILGGAAAVACATFALEAPKGLLEGNILERMRHDLLRALKKPVSERKWVMIIDQQKCIGC